MKILAKNDLLDVLNTWAQKYSILCPTKKASGEIIFDTFNKDTSTLDYKKPSLPQKSSYLPQSEVIFEIKNGEYKEVISSPKTLLFGIRACDMMGICQSKSFMQRDNDDLYFKPRSEGTLTIVMACKGPQNETCFCTTTKSGPYALKGHDLQFYDMGESFIIEAGSEKGEKLLTDKHFKDTDDKKTLQQVQTFRQSAEQSISKVSDVRTAMDKLKDQSVKDDLWEKFGRKCIVCGGCVFVCPTCTCFNVLDHKTQGNNGERIRTWDTCLYGGFTKEASGHNPRGTQGIRLKRRHEHKLLFYNEIDIQEALCGCVGCGRCSDYCPVHIGTLEIVKAIAES